MTFSSGKIQREGLRNRARPIDIRWDEKDRRIAENDRLVWNYKLFQFDCEV